MSGDTVMLIGLISTLIFVVTGILALAHIHYSKLRKEKQEDKRKLVPNPATNRCKTCIRLDPDGIGSCSDPWCVERVEEGYCANYIEWVHRLPSSRRPDPVAASVPVTPRRLAEVAGYHIWELSPRPEPNEVMDKKPEPEPLPRPNPSKYIPLEPFIKENR